jgi:hypothetical protein
VALAAGLAAGNIVEIDNLLTAYLPTNALRTITTFTATAGQTTFSVSYTQGLIDVFYNGSCLAQSEYTATNGTSIILATACQLNDIVVVYAYSYSVGAYSGIGGSGTSGQVPYFTSSSAIASSPNHFWDATNNRLGIGTITPTSPLSVRGTTNTNMVSLGVSGTQTVGDAMGITFTSPTYEKARIVAYNENAGNAAGYLTFWTGGSPATTDITERMRITSAGNVGIGNTTALHKLQIGANADTKTSIGQSILFLSANAGNVGYVNELGFGDVSSTYPQSAIGNIITNATAASYGDLYFATRSVTTDTAPTEKMRIYSTGCAILYTANSTCLTVTNGDTSTDYNNLQQIRMGYGGTSNYAQIIHTRHNGGVGSGNGIDFYCCTGTSTNTVTSGSLKVMTLEGTGSVTLNNFVYGNTVNTSPRTLYIESGTGSLGGISSIRASKKNIENILNVDWIYQLNPVTFNYRKKDDEGNYTEEIHDYINYGLIAEDTAPIIDFIINYNEKEDGSKEMAGIEYPRLIIPLLKAIQEMNTKIIQLEKIVATK